MKKPLKEEASQRKSLLKQKPLKEKSFVKKKLLKEEGGAFSSRTFPCFKEEAS